MTSDRWGNRFTADCHSKPITQLLFHGYFSSFGRPDDGLGFVPSMMEHLHGSTAICGLAIYDADQYPVGYRQQFYSGNVMTSRINRNAIVKHGATLKAQELADFMTSDDSWFRPVDIQLGPDGALYVADFYNKIIGHYEVPLEHPERDRERGRIWRIVYRGDQNSEHPTAPESQVASNPKTAAQNLVDLGSENQTRRELALQRLARSPDPQTNDQLRNHLHTTDNPLGRIGAMWALFQRQATTPADFAKLFLDSNRWCVRMLHGPRVS